MVLTSKEYLRLDIWPKILKYVKNIKNIIIIKYRKKLIVNKKIIR